MAVIKRNGSRTCLKSGSGWTKTTLNLADLEVRYRNDEKEHYTLDLITPKGFAAWLADLRKGKVV